MVGRCARERLRACAEQVLQLNNVRCHYALMSKREEQEEEGEAEERRSESPREQKGHLEGGNRGETREEGGTEESRDGSKRRRRL